MDVSSQRSVHRFHIVFVVLALLFFVFFLFFLFFVGLFGRRVFRDYESALFRVQSQFHNVAHFEADVRQNARRLSFAEQSDDASLIHRHPINQMLELFVVHLLADRRVSFAVSAADHHRLLDALDAETARRLARQHRLREGGLEFVFVLSELVDFEVDRQVQFVQLHIVQFLTRLARFDGIFDRYLHVAVLEPVLLRTRHRHRLQLISVQRQPHRVRVHIVGVEDPVLEGVDELQVGDGVADALLECLVDVLDLLGNAFLFEAEYLVDGG